MHFFLELLSKSNPEWMQDTINATIYFGGGTPGLFQAEYYARLISIIQEKFCVQETTLETNPFSNRIKNFEQYKKAGFDRITLGCQSLCEKTLLHLGRRHTPQQVIDNLNELRKSGFDNIQVDLIYGLQKNMRTVPVSSEIQTLNQAGATGISCYALTIEGRTLFSKNPHFADEDNAVAEYEQILEACAQFGFEQIETSNFSKQSAYHNQIYWHGHPYIGIGTGAHGLLPATKEKPYGQRYKIGENQTQISPGNDRLIYSDPAQCQKNFSVCYEPVRTRKEFFQEIIFTTLRTKQGLSLSLLGKSIDDFLKNKKIERGLKEGKIICKDNHVSLDQCEKIRGDAWALEFISVFDHME